MLQQHCSLPAGVAVALEAATCRQSAIAGLKLECHHGVVKEIGYVMHLSSMLSRDANVYGHCTS
jgi:hypothetical protein